MCFNTSSLLLFRFDVVERLKVILYDHSGMVKETVAVVIKRPKFDIID